LNYVVVDLEATCWDGRDDRYLQVHQRDESQIIEIGAVLVDSETFETINEFSTFVKPTKHTELSEFCHELTSIKQTDVNDAPTFVEAYKEFIAWTGDLNEIALCSWGRYDHNQLVRECREHELESPSWTPINIKEEFSAWNYCHGRSKKGRGLGKAIRMLGLSFSGTAHRGIDDARNAARVLQHVRKPDNMSPLARKYLDLAHKRSPEPTNFGHLKSELKRSDLKQWNPRILQELGRLNLIHPLGGGKGFLPMENTK